MKPHVIASIFFLIVIYLAISRGTYWILGQKKVDHGPNEPITKLIIVSKIDALRCIFGGLFWPLTILLAGIIWLKNRAAKGLQYWSSLPTYNPSRIRNKNEI